MEADNQQLENTTPATATPTTTEAEAVESWDDLQARHRKELKDLQAKITALKKTATKGDKKKKKEVLAEAAQLEKEISLRHKKEEKEARARTPPAATATASAKENEQADDEEEDDDFDPNDIPIDHLILEPAPKAAAAAQSTQQQHGAQGGRKPNRQKLRKDRKAQQIKELQDQAEKEAAGQVDMKEIERQAIEELAQVMELEIKDINADGHCLYNAVADQLAQRYEKTTSVKDLRSETAQYMRVHADDFLPFLTNKHGDIMSSEDFEAYLKELEESAVWGGQPELLALSRVHKVPIWVIQMGSPTVKLSADDYPKQKPLMVSYHRHMYGLGEHYNSLRPKQA
ncbi:OTU domain-containing protein 6B [Actinomortierella ambigua]|nr:OTU domain-containing protein 6B [Actinomortierella ambigua]